MRLALLGTIVTEIGAVGLGVLTGSFTARLLLPEGRGALAAVLFWPQLFTVVGFLSLNEATICRIGARRDRTSTTAASALTLALILASMTALAGYFLLPDLLGESRRGLVPLARTYLLLFAPFNFVALALLAVDLGRFAFRRYNILRVSVPTLYLAGLVVLWGVDSVSVGLVAAVNCSATILIALTRFGLQSRALIARPSVDELWSILKIAGRFHPATLVLFVSAHADRLAVLLLWDTVSLGHYVVAATLAGSGVAVVTGAFARVLFPHLTENSERMHRVRLLARGIRHGTLTLALLSVPLALATPWLVPTVFGVAFLAATPLAIGLTAAYALSALKTILIHSLNAFGESRPGIIAATLSLVLFFAFVWFAGQAGDPIGLVATLAAAELVGLLYLSWYVVRHYDIAPHELWGLTASTVLELCRYPSAALAMVGMHSRRASESQ